MGFERILSVLQGKSSNYDTDLFEPLVRRLEELTGKRYGLGPGGRRHGRGGDERRLPRLRRPHARGVVGASATGRCPRTRGAATSCAGSSGARRASVARYSGVEEPFLFALVPTVAEVLGDAFPEIAAQTHHIQLLVKSEEESFRKTLDRGLVLFERMADKVAQGGSKTLPGAEAYELYATFGFPQDLVELMARERGMDVDLEGWREARNRPTARSASRRASSSSSSPPSSSAGVRPRRARRTMTPEWLDHGGRGRADRRARSRRGPAAS